MPTRTARQRAALLLLVYLAATLLMAAPFIDYGALTTASPVGDARLVIWTLAWDAHALLTGAPLFDANLFFPAPHALRFTEHHLGLALLALPANVVTGNPVLAYWLVWLAAFAANALAMHALAWRLTRSHLGTLAGALVYAFSFYRMQHAAGHLQLLWTAWLPLAVLAAERWYVAPSWPRLAGLWALVLAQALVSWYLAVMVCLAAAVLLIVFVTAGVGRPRVTLTHLVHIAAGAVAGALVLWPLVQPYVALGAAVQGEAAGLSADAAAYLLPPANTWLGRWLLARTSLHPRWIWGEQTIYLGWIALGLAAAGAVRLARDTSADRGTSVLVGAIVTVGAVALALSFGPSASGLAPFDLLRHVPGLELFRAPARFGLLVLMAIATLAALGAARLAATPRGRFVALALVPLMLMEWRVVDFPNGPPERLAVPPAYRQLARLPPGAVVSLPDYRGTDQWFRETDYLLYATVHWRPIANGYGRGEPAGFGALMDDLRTFPSPRATAALDRAGIRYVLCDAERYGPGASDLLARAHREPGLRSLGTTGAITIFEVQP